MMNNKKQFSITSIFVLYILLGIVYVVDNQVISILLSIAIGGYFLIKSPLHHFYFLIGFVPFEGVLQYNGVSVYFIFLFISIFKQLLYLKRFDLNFLLIISFFLYIIVIQLFFDFKVTSIGDFLVLLSIICFFFVYILSSKKEVNIATIVRVFSFSYFVLISSVIIKFGFSNAGNLNPQSIFRFGENAIEVGGAMEIPIYSGLLISLLVVKNFLKRKFILLSLDNLLILIALIVGLLTVSRSFLLILMAIIVATFIFMIARDLKVFLKALCSLLVVIAIVYLSSYEHINKIIIDYSYRFNHDSGFGIRGEIWNSLFAYFNENPIHYLTGLGIRNYVHVGYQLNLLFSSMMHNLYLDGLASFGIIGVIGITIALLIFYKKNKGKPLKVQLIPLIVFLSYAFTAASFNFLKTWIYLLLVVSIAACGKEVDYGKANT